MFGGNAEHEPLRMALIIEGDGHFPAFVVVANVSALKCAKCGSPEIMLGFQIFAAAVRRECCTDRPWALQPFLDEITRGHCERSGTLGAAVLDVVMIDREPV